MIISGELTLGTLAAFIQYLGMLIWPMISFGWVANMIQQAEASMKRLLKIFNEPYEISDNQLTNNSIEKIDGTIEFKNVLFLSEGTTFKVGAPYLSQCTVKAELLGEVKGPKVISFKYKKRKRYHRTVGHRQRYSKVKITEIAG